MRELIDLLESQYLLEDRTQALEAKFIPLIANYFKTGDEDTNAPHRSASRHDLESVTTLYLPAKQAGAFSSARMDSEFHARKEDGIDPEYFFRPAYYTEIAKWAVHWIMSADPDPRKSFSTWLLTLYVKGKYRLEDLNRATDALEIYGDLVQRKRLPVEQRDINKVPDFAALADIVRPYMDSQVESQNAALEAKYVAESEVLLDTPKRRVLKLNSMEAAQWFGRETEWCTAYGGPWGRYQGRTGNMYSHYRVNGPMFVIEDRENNLLYQFHAHSKQLMDVNDRRVHAGQFSDRYPDVDAAFAAWNVKGKLVDTYSGLQFMWDPTGKVRSWLVASPAFGIMWMLGMQNDTMSFTVEKSNGAWSVTQFKCEEHFSPELRAKVIEILNRLKFQGVTKNMMDRGIAFNKGRRKYIEFNQNPTLSRLKRQGKWVWKMGGRDRNAYYDESSSVYRLGDPDKADHYIAQVAVEKSKLGVHTVEVEVPDLTNGKPKSFSFGGLKGLSAGIHDLLTVLANRKDLTLVNSGAVFRALDREHALDLAKTRPDWLQVSEYLLFYGITPAAKRKIVHYASEMNGLDTYGWMGDKLVVAKFKDVADFIEECGDKYFDEMADMVISHKRSYDVNDVYLSDYDMRDMLRSLKPKDLKRISDYMRSEYGGDHEDDEEEYDFDTVEGLIKAQEDLEDDNLQMAFSDGKRSGEESGAENQILEAIKSKIDDVEGLYFVVNGKLTKEWNYDTPMVFAPSAEQIAKEIAEDELYSVVNYGWVRGMNNGDPYKLDQPYNGWDECDDDAMKDRFADAIEEFLP